MELAPLGLKLAEIECFRYRVDDVLQGVNKKTILKTRARELQHEILTDSRLKSKLEQSDDLKALKRSARQIKQSVSGRESLIHMPAYLIPANAFKGATAVQNAIASQSEEAPRRGHKRRQDPLKTMVPQQKKRKGADWQTNVKNEPNHATANFEQLPALSGRKLWKIRHRKKVGKRLEAQGTHSGKTAGRSLRRSSIKVAPLSFSAEVSLNTVFLVCESETCAGYQCAQRQPAGQHLRLEILVRGIAQGYTDSQFLACARLCGCNWPFGGASDANIFS